MKVLIDLFLNDSHGAAAAVEVMVYGTCGTWRL